jgi:hypothetical protein
MLNHPVVISSFVTAMSLWWEACGVQSAIEFAHCGKAATIDSAEGRAGLSQRGLR